MGKPIAITDDTFKSEVLESDLPVVLDFWAVWCGPCKAYDPIMNELAEQYDGKAKIGKVDVDNNQQIAINYGIRSIPTVMIFKDGQLKETIVGVIPKNKLEEKLNAHL